MRVGLYDLPDDTRTYARVSSGGRWQEWRLFDAATNTPLYLVDSRGVSRYVYTAQFDGYAVSPCDLVEGDLRWAGEEE